jgi:hypothetical protein
MFGYFFVKEELNLVASSRETRAAGAARNRLFWLPVKTGDRLRSMVPSTKNVLEQERL